MIEFAVNPEFYSVNDERDFQGTLTKTTHEWCRFKDALVFLKAI